MSHTDLHLLWRIRKELQFANLFTYLFHTTSKFITKRNTIIFYFNKNWVYVLEFKIYSPFAECPECATHSFDSDTFSFCDKSRISIFVHASPREFRVYSASFPGVTLLSLIGWLPGLQSYMDAFIFEESILSSRLSPRGQTLCKPRPDNTWGTPDLKSRVQE